jgi:hypothetical protein
MLPTALWILCLTTIGTTAATTTSSTDFFSPTYSTIPDPTTSEFTGTQYTYRSYSGQSTVAPSSSALEASSSGTQSTRSTTTDSLTHIGGLSPTNGTNATSSSTLTANAAENTVPCNNYPEFCNRKYSNITEVCSHNSAFAIPNNAGSNQVYGIIDQLNDGVRMRELAASFSHLVRKANVP